MDTSISTDAFSLSLEINDLKAEIKMLRDLIDENYPRDLWWLLTKLDNQRVALDNLQRKGKGHTKEEREAMALATAS